MDLDDLLDEFES